MSVNDEQREFWDTKVGAIWVEQQQVMDALFSKILDETLNRAELAEGHSVLDIGCGAGTSTFAIADSIGGTGHVTGLDISPTLLVAAQKGIVNQTNISFLDADVQEHPLVVDSADRVISRFGVMFFEDSVAAFRNMAEALREDGLISFSAWGAIEDNPFFTLPAKVARDVLGPIPKTDPDGPGPFAFRDVTRVEGILRDAGLEPQVEVLEIPLHLKGGTDMLVDVLCKIGPAQSALAYHDADKEATRRLVDALAQAFEEYEHGDEITIPSSINFVTARKAS
ncbi:MAG: class I SAM-dependent methyltransferase [Sulfitobacter sp.]